MIKENNRMDSYSIKLLKSAILNQRFAHAYLFHGSDLSVQSDTAMWLTRALNCIQISKKNEPCDDCLSCAKIMRGTHPDVTLWKPQGALRGFRVEQIRRLREESMFKPYEGKVKVQILYEADCLNQALANALLKVLEEPPVKTYFILLTTERENLLPTIRSRCQEVRFLGEAQPFKHNQFPECGNDQALLEVLWEFAKGNPELAGKYVQDGLWEKRKQMISSVERAIGGPWIQLFGEMESIIDLTNEDLEDLEAKGIEEEERLAAGDREFLKELIEERSAFISGERKRRVEELFRLILVWARVKLQENNAFMEFPHWVDAVDEARRLLNRGMNPRWILEFLMISLKMNKQDVACTV